MYEGKHARKQASPDKPKKTGYLRVFFLWSLLIFLLVGATGFVYAKFLEGRMHRVDKAYGGNEGEIQLPPPTNDKPVTFVLLGSDTRGDPEDPGRSDTLMVFRMNPKKNIAYLVSIPRDARVDIPGHGKQKINAAYQLGGPMLVIKTVEKLTGFEINHFAIVDFQGFKEIVDALGGININVEKKIRDHFDGEVVNLDPGMHHFNGREALNYVRVRHVDDDFGRMGRQQQFLRAVMDKLMRPSSVTKILQLAEIVSHNVRTDAGLGITQMISYGQQMKTIGRKNTNMITLTGGCQTIGDISYVFIDKHQTDWLFGRMKKDLPPQLTKEEKQNKNIRIQVQNGSGKPGMAKEMGDKLSSLNFKVTNIGNAPSFDYYETQIVVPAEKEDLGKRVQSELGFGHVSTDGIASDSINVVVVVGRDFAYMTNDSNKNR